MKPTLLYRIASILLVLFAAAHTIGFLRFVPLSAEGIAVRDAMHNVHFAVRNGSYTYGGFYNGFGLSVSVYLLFAAFLAWHLGTLAARDPKAIGMLGWAFFVMELVQLAICATYFFLPPIVSTAVVALCLGAAAWRVRSLG